MYTFTQVVDFGLIPFPCVSFGILAQPQATKEATFFVSSERSHFLFAAREATFC